MSNKGKFAPKMRGPARQAPTDLETDVQIRNLAQRQLQGTMDLLTTARNRAIISAGAQSVSMEQDMLELILAELYAQRLLTMKLLLALGVVRAASDEEIKATLEGWKDGHTETDTV